MADPVTATIIGTVLGAAVSLTQLGSEIIHWFYEPEPICYTKVNDEPEQWRNMECIDEHPSTE